MAIVVDTQLEKYTLEAELSQDEWFTLYRGYRKSDGAAVVIKVVSPLLATDEFFVRRFQNLASQTAQLEHPNILRTYEAEQEGDWLYVVQDFVEARSLTQVIAAEGPFSPQRMQFIAGQIASALDYAHQKGIPHGDLSAHQVYLGPNDHVLMANFGQTQAILGTNLAQQSYALSSPEILAPERAHGQGPSRPADLYALGILCYQMLAKQPPFTGPSSMVLHAQAYKQPRPLHRVNPGISIAVSEIIGRMLAKGVELRYSTGAEFVRALSVACRGQQAFKAGDFSPLFDSGQRQWLTAKTVVYFCSGLVMVLFITILSVWAGYELGLKHAPRGQSPTQSRIAPVVSTPSDLDSYQEASEPGYGRNRQTTPPATAPLQAEAVIPPLIRSRTFASLSDTLLSTATLRSEVISATATTTLTPRPPAPTPASPKPAHVIPAGQGLFIFYNPTGYDLVVDLTGPAPASVLVPPDHRHEFLLAPGSYQHIVHTPTGHWLATKVGTFNLAEGQVLERDYYSDYDLTLPQP